MGKVSVIDLDGVIADSTVRFAKADEAKALYIKQGHSTKEATNIYCQTAFTPELVSLDILIDGTFEAIQELERSGYDIVLLTSRPETMREATVQWLARYGLDGYPLTCKPLAEQYTKTVKWKADEVERIVMERWYQEVLFIDDEEGNRQAIEKLEGVKVVCKSCL